MSVAETATPKKPPRKPRADKVAKEPELPKGPSPRHASERYEVMTIERSAITNADYNPREITDQSRKKLRAAISEVGLLGPVIWNRRTGRLVGGHQRLSALDALAKKNAYTLCVSAVDLSDDDERAANILLNNPEAQGSWDLEKLGAMLKDPNLPLIKAGLGSADVYKIIGDQASAEVLQECADRIHEMRDVSTATEDSAVKKGTDYYLVVVFKDYEARKVFTAAAGLDDNRYVSGEDMQRMVDAENAAKGDEVDAAQETKKTKRPRKAKEAAAASPAAEETGAGAGGEAAQRVSGL